MPSPTKAELTHALAAARAEIAAQERRMAACERAREVAAALSQVGKELAETLDVGQVTGRIVTAVLRLVRGRRAVLFQHDPASGTLTCVASVGDGTADQWLGRSLPAGCGIAGRAVADAQPVWTADLLADPRLTLTEFSRERIREEGYRASVGLPLVARGAVVGALVLNDAAGRDFSEDDLEILTFFADQAAIALENARLYQQEQWRRGQLEAVRAVSAEITRELDLSTLLALINQRAVELVGAGSGVVWLWDEAAQVMVPRSWHGYGDWLQEIRLRPGEGPVGVVAQRREGLILNDYRTYPYAHPRFLAETQITAVLCEPLLYHDRLLGAITVDNTGMERGFTEQDQKTLVLFAAHAAIAIENARLHTAAVRRGEELRALLRAAHLVMAELDLPTILDRIVAEAAEISGCGHVKVLLVDRAAEVLRPGAIRGTAMSADDQLPLGVGHSGIVAKTGQRLFCADAPADVRNVYAERDRQLGLATYLGLPIKSRNTVLGVLTFNTTTPREYTPEELAYLTSFADQAAIAIENARLFAELNQSYRDLQQAQDELIRSEKLRALGQMAAGIAHDLNNMLAAILGQVELLRIRASDAVTREALATLETAATDGAHVVRRLQDFARQRPRTSLAPVDLTQTVQEALEITRPRWRDEAQRQGRVIEVHTALEDIPPILGHAPEVREALTNVILNAVDAMPHGGVLSLTARRLAGGTGKESGAAGARPAPVEWVELAVRDTGVGMAEETRRRIFEPFFSTKGMHGTGLGLSVVYGIVERHQGRVQVASAPGQGTVIALRFQAASGLPEAPPPPPQTRVSPRRILLIDDDPGVRQTLGSLLRAVGHEVSEAAGGAAGLARLSEDSVDLVLTDLGMPEVTGWDVARAVKAMRPHPPVVLLTGWGEHSAAEADEPGAAGLVDRVMGKPFRLDELLRVIAELTGGAAPSRPGAPSPGSGSA